MAFKRSAVRSRLSPPSQGKVLFLAPAKERGFVLCGNRNDVRSETELLKVDIKINVQLIAPVDFHPFDQAVDDHQGWPRRTYRPRK